jgi:hypothetical protein
LVGFSDAAEMLSFAWWNTSLKPLKDKPVAAEHQAIARTLVRAIIAELDVDFVALGEVSPSDSDMFRDLANEVGYFFLDGIEPAGKSWFDTCFLYKQSRVAVHDMTTKITNQGNRTLRIAQQVDLFISGATLPIHLFVSHWPSPLYKDDVAKRRLLGQRLHDLIRKLEEDYGQVAPNVLLLGDFNDEPFDDSLSEALRSTRHRKLVERGGGLLYNPFWRYLGAGSGIEPPEGLSLLGTYFHRPGTLTQWRVLDQIIFSKSFLGGGEWTIDERLTQLLDIPQFSPLLQDGKNGFDHAPILGTVRRN